jgi:glutathione S-transferase
MIPGDSPVAGGEVWSLADFHLAPMMFYFTTAAEGEEALARYARLSAWWEVIRERKSVQEVVKGVPSQRPNLP